MAEVSNQKVIERYKDLLANRTHDVIIRDAALDVVEAELRTLKDENQKLSEENETFKRDLGRANEYIRRLQGMIPNAASERPPVIPGEVVKPEEIDFPG
ncbi:MAG: hypothetical protein LC723_12620 [Actinobacteria bacterium]|nr:hypothetical protein [Actinomycetota bacterium]